MSLPVQKPGRSKQDYGTPPEFIAAVKARLSIEGFVIDLAATGENAIATWYFGDSLKEDWTNALRDGGWGWLNPPFANIAPWVKKALEASKEGAHIAVLVPAGVGSNWWRDYVHHRADVLFLNGRITFLGTPPNPKTGKPDPYPKDCALLLYGPGSYACHGSYDVWNWREEPADPSGSSSLRAEDQTP